MNLEDTFAFEDSVRYLVETVGVPPVIENRKEVYICIRTDGAAGSGTIQDPYNGSTDDLLDLLLSDPVRITPRMTIRFGPGVFQTKGNGGAIAGWAPQTGQRIIGSGMYQTTLQLVKAAPAGSAGNFIAPIAVDTGSIDDLEVSDMTIDANLSRQPLVSGAPATIRTEAIRIQFNGTNIKIRRVRAINWGTYLPFGIGGSTTREGFPIYIQGPDSGTDNENIVEDCVIEQPNFSPGREVSLLNVHAGGFPNTFCTLRNNYLNAEFTTLPRSLKSKFLSVSVTT